MSQELVFDTKTEAEKKIVWWLYLAHGASLVFSLGAFGWIPLIVNYVKRSDTKDSFLSSHHSWQIRSFWWYVFWLSICVILAITIIGIPLAWLIGFSAWLWKVYRLIRGFIDLDANKPMP